MQFTLINNGFTICRYSQILPKLTKNISAVWTATIPIICQLFRLTGALYHILLQQVQFFQIFTHLNKDWKDWLPLLFIFTQPNAPRHHCLDDDDDDDDDDDGDDEDDEDDDDDDDGDDDNDDDDGDDNIDVSEWEKKLSQIGK